MIKIYTESYSFHFVVNNTTLKQNLLNVVLVKIKAIEVYVKVNTNCISAVL